MDPNNDQNLETIRVCIVHVLSSDNAMRKKAEEYMLQFSGDLQFSLLLIHLINRLLSNCTEKAVRQTAAVMLKNNIKKNWIEYQIGVGARGSGLVGREEGIAGGSDEGGGGGGATDDVREIIKYQIIEIINSCPIEVQKQLVEAISIIAAEDFPDKWSALFPHLLSKLTNITDMFASFGILLTLNAVLKRFRYLAVTDTVMMELQFSLEHLQDPLLILYRQNSLLIDTLVGDQPNFDAAIENQRLMTRIFFSLNVIDLPEYFEDHMEEWMNEFNKFLTYSNPLLANASDTDKPGPVENLKTAIIESLILYAQKYEDEFKPFLSSFTQTIFQLLIECGAEPKSDGVATNAIKLLSSICGKESNRDLFNRDALQSLIEKIVINNMILSENDAENFEDSSSDYIRKDHEGSDIFTRRRSATDLVRGLMKLYKPEVSEICLGYVNYLFQQSTTEWKYKDAAIHLVIAVSCMSTSSANGLLELNHHIDIVEIIQTHILPELQDPDVNSNPFIKADALKIICHFRSQFNADTMESLLPFVVNYLTSKYAVVHTYAAICIDRYLAFTDVDPSDPSGKTKVPRLNAARLAAVEQSLLSNLFNLLLSKDQPVDPSGDPRYEILDYHEYIMICIKQCLITMDIGILPITNIVFSSLMSILKSTCDNLSTPVFYHNLFESVALLIKSACQLPDPAQVLEICSKFEAFLFPLFQHILQNDVVEYVVYMYQIMAALLSYRPQGSGLSDIFKQVFSIAVNPTAWEMTKTTDTDDIRISRGKGNIPALVDLLRAYLLSSAVELTANEQITPIFGVFQLLNSVKSSEPQAFKLLGSLTSSLPLTTFSAYLSPLLQLQLTVLQRQRDHSISKYSLSFLSSLCQMVVNLGVVPIYDTLESLTFNLVGMLACKVWPLTLAQVRLCSDKDCRIIVLGLSKLCFETPVINSVDVFIAICKQILTVLAYMEGLDLGDRQEEVLFSLEEEDFESREFDSVYSKLKYAAVPDFSPPPDCWIASIYFARKLSELCQSRPGYYSGIVEQCISADQNKERLFSILAKILQEVGVTLL